MYQIILSRYSTKIKNKKSNMLYFMTLLEKNWILYVEGSAIYHFVCIKVMRMTLN